MVKLEKETGSLAPKRQGNPGRGKLGAFTDWVRELIDQETDLTLADIRDRLRDIHGVSAHQGAIWHWLRRLGLRYKKNADGL